MKKLEAAASAGHAQSDHMPPFVQESKLRRLLSRSPKNLEAWQALIQLVLMNSQYQEALRLSTRALEHFSNDPAFLSSHLQRLLNLGLLEEARPLLEQAASGAKGSLEKRLDIAELEFLRDPRHAAAIFQNYAAQIPAHIRVITGMQSAHAFQNFGRPKIGFFLGNTWHWPIQKTVVEALNALHASSFVTTRLWMLKALAPAVVVVSDATPKTMQWLRLNLPSARIVSIRHGVGVGGKNYGLYAAAATDHICVSSEWVKRDLCRDALLTEDRVWVTGFSQMDGLFRASANEARPAHVKRVTYAPTFDLKLSSVAVIGDHPVRWIRGNNSSVHLTIRPHPHLLRDHPGLMNEWRQSLKGEQNVQFDDGPLSDLSTLLAQTDLLISDVSSVALQFMALNRPIICVIDEEQARSSPKYAPEELEWKMHAAAVKISRKEELRSAVDSALHGVMDPQIQAERARIQRYLYEGMTDGRASERIAERLLQLTRLASC